MLTKFLDEVAKRFLDAALSRPLGWLLISAIACTSAIFLGLQYIREAPRSLDVLQNPILFSSASLTALVGVAFLLRVRRNVPRFVAIPVLTAACLTIVAYAIHIFVDRAPHFKVDVVFDGTVAPTPRLQNMLTQTVQSKHFHFTVLDRNLYTGTNRSGLLAADVLGQAASRIRDKSLSTHTILVTSLPLSNSEYANLFYSVQGNLAVLSLYGIADIATIEGQNLILRYLASMLPLVAMHAEAAVQNRTLLPTRSPDTERGCLHDFSSYKLALIEKLRSGPTLCAEETEAIKEAFGERIIDEYREILRQTTALTPSMPAPTSPNASPAPIPTQGIAFRPPSADVLFGENDSLLDEKSKSVLEALLARSRGEKVAVYVVTGHADFHESGGDALHYKVSMHRAEVVKAFLILNGITPNRVYVKGVGSGQPTNGVKSEYARAGNRRVTVEAELEK